MLEVDKDIFEISDDEISAQEAIETSSLLLSLKRQIKDFEFLQHNQELKCFKTPRSNPHVDPIEGFKDILDEFDIKISEPRPWNYPPK